MVDILDEALQHHAHMVERVMATKGVSFSSEMKEEDFLATLKGDVALVQLTEPQLSNVYQHVSISLISF